VRPLSGSALPIFVECAWWARDDVTYKDVRLSEDEAAAADGTAAHEAAASGPGLDPEANAKADQIAKRLEKEFAGCKLHKEIALAYDPKSGKAEILGWNIGREYEKNGLKAGWIPGSFDLIVIGEQNVVIDYKAGSGVHVEKPQDNAQLAFGALMAERAFGVTIGRVAIWYPRVDRVWEEDWELDPWLLPAFETRLKKQLRVAQTEKPQPKPGEHCRYCPALGGCPATKSALAEIVDPGEFEWTTDIQSMSHAAWLAGNVAGLEVVVKKIRQSLKEYADSCGGIPLPDGKVWRAVDGYRESLNTAAVKAYLGDRVGEFMSKKSFKTYKAVKE